MVTETTIREIKKQALGLKRDVIEMIGVGNAGHLGGSCSLAEAMAVLYFHKANISKNNMRDPGRDRIILSKGHAVLIQYACLCRLGFFSRDELKKVKTLDGLLQGHPDLCIPGIEAVTGSLGQGLSVSLGMALALRLDKLNVRVYTIMGDGEQSEGQLWEASQAAANFKADNLTAFIDWNKIQATGFTRDVFDIPNLDRKWTAFGWEVFSADGHDPLSIITAIEKAEQVKEKPQLIILDTVKGRGFSFAENSAAYHNGIMDEKTYALAMAELNAAEEAL